MARPLVLGQFKSVLFNGNSYSECLIAETVDPSVSSTERVFEEILSSNSQKASQPSVARTVKRLFNCKRNEFGL